jgi:hypothetical protein
MTKYCSSCHTPNPERARRCRGCGGRFSGIRTPTFGFDSTRLGAAETAWPPPARHPVRRKPSGRKTRSSTAVAAVALKLAALAGLAGAAVLVAQLVPADRWGQAIARWTAPAAGAPATPARQAVRPTPPPPPAASEASAVLEALGLDPARIDGRPAAESRPPADGPAIGSDASR